MDVVINSATETGGFGFFAFGDGDPQVGRVYNSNGTGAATAGPNEGLLTRFTSCATSVPDSATTVLLFGFGLSGIVGVRKTLQSRRA